ncbi:hypothetical protein AUC47_08360 [Microbacterium sp. SZ1]|uniref:type IV toxin-antitoxin system AbiEi family antitoxin n=1 Tax=Microbacterium sp. SZ1 TaxID=1849736 RepID=UPI000BBCD7E8|nr:type IV toxin-antitoxin system AbiEi family antitoxin [Microbacterium sp. SZ1]PCE13794.1 hypothetical protein AUC47_08360 [Microbacterium sp. SZ1]
MHPALLYLPGGRLTLPELSAARLDGHVIELGEGYVPADLVESPPARAAAIAEIVPANTAACGPSAAWVHGAGDQPPARHHVRRAVPHRLRVVLPPRVVLHDTALPDDDVVTLGGILVMTPVRTMVDLALGLHRDPTRRPWIDLLADADPDLLDDAASAIDDMHRMPGARVARAALERAILRTR